MMSGTSTGKTQSLEVIQEPETGITWRSLHSHVFAVDAGMGCDVTGGWWAEYLHMDLHVSWASSQHGASRLLKQKLRALKASVCVLTKWKLHHIYWLALEVMHY